MNKRNLRFHEFGATELHAALFARPIFGHLAHAVLLAQVPRKQFGLGEVNVDVAPEALAKALTPRDVVVIVDLLKGHVVASSTCEGGVLSFKIF